VGANYLPPDNIDVWDAENVYYLRSHPSRIAKLLSHYELYREIIGLPGAIVECGVYKGASLCRFAAFRALLENDHSRRIYGLDAFGPFPSSIVESDADRKFIAQFEALGGAGISEEVLSAALAAKGYSNVELVKGDVFETIPALLTRVPHLRIALLHLDMDVYEPTRFAVDHLLPHMTIGGLIVFDDYNAVEGATRAADELCAMRGLTMQKGRFYNVPAYTKI
jgi:hypothetical protein